jgi:chaperonin GroES
MAATKTKTSIRPLDDRVVIKRLSAEEKSSGGILLPENAKEKPQQGKVLAVGPGKLLDDGSRATPDLKEGDTVIFGKYSGSEITVDGDELIIMRESDILGKVD